MARAYSGFAQSGSSRAAQYNAISAVSRLKPAWIRGTARS